MLLARSLLLVEEGTCSWQDQRGRSIEGTGVECTVLAKFEQVCWVKRPEELAVGGMSAGGRMDRVHC